MEISIRFTVAVQELALSTCDLAVKELATITKELSNVRQIKAQSLAPAIGDTTRLHAVAR